MLTRSQRLALELGQPEQHELAFTRCGYFGGGSSSNASTSSSTTTTSNTQYTTNTQNIDKRLLADGGVGVSSDESTVNVSVLDQGAVQHAIDLVNSADTRQSADYQQFLALTKDAFGEVLKVVQKNQDFAAQIASGAGSLAKDLTASLGSAYEIAQKTTDDAYTSAESVKSGVADQQKTLLIVGAIAAGLYYLSRK